MEIDIKGIVVIVGNFGSGKSEVTINLGINRKQAGVDVAIADLDIINPYFRTREVKELLSGQGIDLVLPPDEFQHADLPVISPAVLGMFQTPRELTLVDCGGDDAGPFVLRTFGKSVDRRVQMLQVINPFRPATQTVDGCMKMKMIIELAATIPVSGFIGNANRINETTAEDILSGYGFMKTLSDASALPIAFITAGIKLIPEIRQAHFSVPVLPIERRLAPPWEIRT